MQSATSQARFGSTAWCSQEHYPAVSSHVRLPPLPAKRQVDHYLSTVNVVTVNPFTFEFSPPLTSSEEM